ncbi:MAG TPA: hypothetical protein PKV48_00915 [Thermodesulfobacteriota bacterium]|nr:hypothetical protein [Thermodesulfobacteriota bacterium]
MKREEIFKKYRNEWLLIECKEVDENFEVVEGKILHHSKDKDEIYRKLLELRPKDYAIEYTGKVPENLAVML